MGVRGLHTFAKDVVRNGLLTVSMEEECREYYLLYRRNPVLVIDFKVFYHWIYEGDHEKLLGGRFQTFNERLRKMLRTLHWLGYELVLFVGEARHTRNAETPVNRRDAKYDRRVKILHAIDDELDLSSNLEEYDIPYFSVFYRNFIEISREYGELYHSVVHEYEQDLVSLAKDRDAFAIVSNDTNYLIFDAPWKFWRDLNFNDNTAKEYNKEAIRQHLALSQPQMVLFASLVGNGFLSQELLSMFHTSLRNTENVKGKHKFEQIASYIRSISWLPHSMQSKDILDLARRIFAPADLDRGIKELQNSIHFYCLTNMEVEADSFLKKVSEECRIFIYNVLKKDIVTLNFDFCDLSKPVFPPYFDFIKPIIGRLVGVLFSHKENRSFSKKFRVKLDHFQPFMPVDVPANFPPGKVPPLEDLLLTPYGENKNLDEIRWDLLCFMISPKIKMDRLRSIPGFSLATYATLYYLVEENLIDIDEADCILFSCDERNPFPDLQTEFSIDKVKTIDGRDARMVFLFLGVTSYISNCFSAAGLQKYCGLITFDGLYFHNLRKVWNQLDGNQINSVRNRLQPYRIYAQTRCV